MDVFAKSLAPALGFAEAEVNEWLNIVFQKIAEDLILEGSVYISGVGELKRVHIPSEPKETNGKLSLSPPRHVVQLFQANKDDLGVVYDYAIGSIQLKEDVAERFSKGFSRVVEKVVDVRGVLTLGGLGEITRGERDTMVFKQSDMLSELLDKQFSGLSLVVISDHNQEHEITESAAQGETHIHPTAETPEINLSPADYKEAEIERLYAQTSQTLPSDTVVPIGGDNERANNGFGSLETPILDLKPTDTTIAVSPPSSSFMGIDTSESLAAETNIRNQQSAQPVNQNNSREPLFLALAAAAKAELEPVSVESQISFPKPEDPKANSSQQPSSEPFRFEASAVPAPKNSLPEYEKEIVDDSSLTSSEDNAWLSESIKEKETPIIRNITIATLIVFFTIIAAFFIIKYDSISFTPPPPPQPLDRAKVEAEKAAAARAEAERVIAEKAIRRAPSKQDTSTANLFDKRAIQNPKVDARSKRIAALPKELTSVDVSLGGFTIVVASQPTLKEAEEIADEFRQQGLAITILERKFGNKSMFRVRIGQFKSKAEALQIKKKYPSVIPADAFIDKMK